MQCSVVYTNVHNLSLSQSKIWTVTRLKFHQITAKDLETFSSGGPSGRLGLTMKGAQMCAVWETHGKEKTLHCRCVSLLFADGFWLDWLWQRIFSIGVPKIVCLVDIIHNHLLYAGWGNTGAHFDQLRSTLRAGTWRVGLSRCALVE